MSESARSGDVRETEGLPLPSDVFSAMLSDSLLSLRGYAVALARSESAADDILQESALKAWKSRERFAAGSNFRGWFCRIVRNEAITVVRRSKAATGLGTVPQARLATSGGQEDRLQAADLMRIFHELPARHREILTLICHDDLSYDEAAAAMDCSVSTVKSRLWRARGEMQKRLFAKGHMFARRLHGRGTGPPAG